MERAAREKERIEASECELQTDGDPVASAHGLETTEAERLRLPADGLELEFSNELVPAECGASTESAHSGAADTQSAQAVPSMQLPVDAVLSVDHIETRPAATSPADEVSITSRTLSSGGGRFRINSMGEDLRQKARSATYTEAFYDLIYFIPLARLTSQPPTSYVFSRFPLYFAAIFFAWKGEAFFNTRFDPDDLTTKLLALIKMCFVVMMGWGLAADNNRSFALGYGLCRIVLVAQYIHISVVDSLARWCANGLAVGFGISALLWLCSLASSEDAVILALWTTGALIDLVTPFLLLGRMLPLHHEHLPERFMLFTVVVLSVMLLEYVDRDFSGEGMLSWVDFYCLTLGVLAPFCLLMLYSNGTGFAPDWQKPKDRLWAYLYLYMHLPLTGCITAATLALKKISCDPDAEEKLEEKYANAGWVFCLTMGLSLVFLGVQHALSARPMRFGVLARVGSGVLMSTLSALGDTISNKAYLYLVNGLLVVVVVLDHLAMGGHFYRPASPDLDT